MSSEASMIFPQTAEYALRAVVQLAAAPERPLTTQEIAASTKVPAGYLAKVLQALGRAGLVRSQRGIHGGFSLARAASEVSVLEVVDAVAPVQRITTCPLGLEEHGSNLCPMHRRVDDALALVQRAFADTTLDELVAGGQGVRPLCSE